MKNSIKILLAICLFSLSIASAQDRDIKKANDYYNNFAYIDAIKAFEEIVKDGRGTLDIYQKLGDSYFYNSDLKNAAKWYQNMIDTKEKISHEHYFRAVQAFKSIGEYHTADSFMEVVLLTIDDEDSRAKLFSENLNYLEEIKKQAGRYNIAPIAYNSAFTDFAPSLYKNQLVFSSSRKKGKFTDQKNKWTKQPYLELLSSDIDENGALSMPIEFSSKLNSRLHESTSVFTKDGKTVYFTRNNLLSLKFKKDSIDVNRLKIFKATLNEKMKWGNIEELYFNSDHYSVAHPSLSDDGSKLYFASDMPGGYGMSDIYVVDISEDGSFGVPKNLGPDINTESRDTFPFISKTGMLYFASNGHIGLGGLDIFAIQLDDPEAKIHNIGEPINSPSDDITFVIDDTTKKGYFASNRPGGKGDDDIYSLEELKPLVTSCEGSLGATAINQENGAILIDADIEVKDQEGNVVYSGKTNAKGSFMLDVNCDNVTYSIKAAKEGFDTITIIIPLTKEHPNIKEILKLQKSAPAKGIDLAKLLDLQPIYFASNKALIREETKKELDKVLNYMKEYPSISIEIGSHTDSRGSDQYNMKLSTRRATATANYIISKGIDPSRVKSRGYGETVLKNKCGNRVKCSKDEHALNRRSEFIVIGN